MTFETDSLRGVKNHYNAQNIEPGMVGELPGNGAIRELTVHISGETLNNGFIEGATLPSGALPLDWSLEIDEVFDLGGTSPTILVGTKGSEATNGLSISEAVAEAVATTNSTTFAGTWGSSLAAETTVGIAMGGTSPTADTTAGKARLVVRYVYL